MSFSSASLEQSVLPKTMASGIVEANVEDDETISGIRNHQCGQAMQGPVYVSKALRSKLAELKKEVRDLAKSVDWNEQWTRPNLMRGMVCSSVWTMDQHEWTSLYDCTHTYQRNACQNMIASSWPRSWSFKQHHTTFKQRQYAFDVGTGLPVQGSPSTTAI